MNTSADQMLASIQALPLGVHAVVALIAVAGVVLWSAGRSVLKPVLVLTAAAAGGLGGFLLLPLVAPEAGVSPFWGGAGGAVIGFLCGFLLFRLALAAVFGCVLGAGFGVLGAAIMAVPWAAPPAAELAIAEKPAGSGGDEQPFVRRGERWIAPPTTPQAEPESQPDEQPDAQEDWLDGPNHPTPGDHPAPKAIARADVVDRSHAATTPPTGPSTGPRDPLNDVRNLLAVPDQATASARNFLAALRERLDGIWNALSGLERLVIGFAMTLGLVAGGLAGLLMPAWAAGAVTALAGAALWIPAAVWLAQAFNVPGHERLDLPATGWAIIWGVASIAGVAIQWAGLARANNKPAPKRRATKNAS